MKLLIPIVPAAKPAPVRRAAPEEQQLSRATLAPKPEVPTVVAAKPDLRIETTADDDSDIGPHRGCRVGRCFAEE